MRARWQTLKVSFVRLIFEEGGQSTIEYALLTGIVAVAAISVLGRIRVNMVGIYSTIEQALTTAPVGPAP